MPLAKDPNFSLSTADATGYVPDVALVGRTIRHRGNQKEYLITGFAWLGATDEWGFVHIRQDGNPVVCCRPISHLTGNRDDGAPRYDMLEGVDNFDGDEAAS